MTIGRVTLYGDEKSAINDAFCLLPQQNIQGDLFEGILILTTDGAIYSYDENGVPVLLSGPVITDEPAEENAEVISNLAIKIKKLENKTAITGIEPKTKVGALKSGKNFKEGYTVKVFNSKNEEISDNANLGTGNIIRIYEGDKLVKEYIVVIYGDTNGDGTIGAIDALGIVKNKNGKVLFKDIAFVEAGRIKTKDGEIPAAIDGLAIIRHVMGKTLINQSK